MTNPNPTKPVMLDNLRVASPCQASWESMEGNEQRRFCPECNKHVYNISAMTRPQAENLLSSGQQICGRFYRRADGTILTEDCPVGLRAKAQRLRRRLGFAIAGALGLSTAFAQSRLPEGVHMRAEESAQPDLSGTVSDITGAVIVGATVTVTDLETKKSTLVRTNGLGQFRVPATDEMSYEIKVDSPGFRSTTVPTVYIVAKHRRVVDITLQISATVGTVVQIVETKPARLSDQLK